MTPQFELAASMDLIRAAHPEWTEEQCREEFNRIARQTVLNMMQKGKKK